MRLLRFLAGLTLTAIIFLWLAFAEGSYAQDKQNPATPQAPQAQQPANPASGRRISPESFRAAGCGPASDGTEGRRPAKIQNQSPAAKKTQAWTAA